MSAKRRRAAARRMKTIEVERPSVPPSDDPVEQLIARARKLRARGDQRRALLVLREACSLDEWRARSFAMLGAWLAEARHGAEATQALRHACWLRGRAGEPGRARATERLLARFTAAA